MVVLMVGAGVADGQPVWVEDFEGPGNLASRGWRVEADESQSHWTILEGHLEMQGLRNPYKGGRIVHDVPIIERGVLEFDCLLAAQGAANYDHLSLGLKLYGHLMAFKKYAGHHFMAHVPAENIMYSATGKVPLGEWVHFRVEFDAPRGRVEYYMGEARDPLMIDTRLTMNTEGEGGEFEWFNYGLTKGAVTSLVDNVRLRRIESHDGQTTAPRERTLLVLGPSSERLGIEGALRHAVPAEKLSVYVMQTRSSATRPSNIFSLDSVPGAATWREARRIILADVPAGPRECLPPHLLGDLERAVTDGCDLLVLGGPFALGSGRYAGTPLQDLLPVALDGPWRLRRFDAPQPLATEPGEPAVLWYHDVPSRDDDVQTALTAGGKPLYAWRPHGKGRVGVFLAAALGSLEDFGEAIPFWEWDGWPRLVERMMTIGGVVGEEG